MSSKDTKEEGSKSDFDDIVHSISSMVESLKKKKLKEFDFVTEVPFEAQPSSRQLRQVKNKSRHKRELRNPSKLKQPNMKWKARSKITNCDALTRNGLITLKVYREDRTSEVILNFKSSDLNLGEWRELVNACPNKKGKGWSTIYGQIKTRMDYLYETEAELGIELDKPLSEQDPLDKLNDLAKKKKKNADDIHDYLRANKRLKSSVQYEDHPARTVLNELFLGMIMFNSYHMHDFVTIEDFGDF
nr:hypothetical protein [Tanacetum cinerariifolium]